MAIYFRTDAAHYTMLGLMVDFALRFLGGGNASPIGCLALVIRSFFDIVGGGHGSIFDHTAFGKNPIWKTGLAVQFANVLGLGFSALATRERGLAFPLLMPALLPLFLTDVDAYLSARSLLPP